MRNRIPVWVLLLSGIVLLVSFPDTLYAQSTGKTEEDWTADESMRLYFEAITIIRKNGVQPLPSRHIVQKTLKMYLQSLDPFSDYLSPEEYANYKLSQQSNYAGVGMEIEKNKAGQIVCTPYPDGPAAKAGIEMGDILEAVDGTSVAGQSILTVGMKIRGQQGTAVRLTLTKKSGVQKELRITRATVQSKSVWVEQRGTMPILRILSFTNGTLQELKEAFGTLQGTTPVILDLRGNPGGALFSAIDAAMLFLDQGKKIVSIKTQKDTRDYQSTPASPSITAPLYLWQDEQTASAAEVFIAALTQNQRAVSIGKKTFGKGVVQQIIPLSDGSALYVTTGVLQTPDGTLYHESGLHPTYPLSMSTAKTEDYLLQVKILLEQQGTSSPSSTGLSKKVEQPQTPAQPGRLPEPPQSSVTTPSSLPEQKSLSLIYLLCFDKDFVTEQDARLWSLEVQFSLRDKFDHYLLQRKKAGGIKFMLCLGPFQTKDDAEKKQRPISNAMNTAMFTEVLAEDALR
jgi:carboxyl-terminal processing protease